MQTDHHSYCRLCNASCGLVATIDAHQLLKVRGDTANAYSEGYICGKARTLGDVHRDVKRPTLTMLGRPPQRSATDLATALDDLGHRLRSIIDESGPDAVGVYLGTAGFLSSGAITSVIRLASELGSRSYYTSVTIDAIAKVVASLHLTGGAHTLLTMPVDVSATKLLLMFGHNPVVSHQGKWSNPVVRLRRIRERGEVWAIDPRRSETAQLADHHLQLRAGTDAFLTAYLIRELLQSGADETFIAERTAGVENLREAVKSHTLSRTAERTGLAETDLVRLRDTIRAAGRIAVTSGTGTRMGTQPVLSEFLIYALAAITGSLDAPGGNITPLRGLAFAPDWATAEAPGPKSRPELRTWAGQYPCTAMADEIEAGNLRALLSFGGNPASAFPDEQRIKQALSSLEVFAVHDIVPTASSDLATHFFPATGQLEEPSFVAATTPQRQHMVQIAEAILEPAGDQRPAWWLIREVAGRIGLQSLADADEQTLLVPTSGAASIERARASDDGMAIGDRTEFGQAHAALPEGRWNLGPSTILERLATLEEPPPLVLIPRRQPRHVNSYLVDTVGPSGKRDQCEVLVNTFDAQAAAVADGDHVTVTSTNGHLTLRARVTPDIARGALSIPHGYEAANVNLLTSSSSDVDEFSGMPRFSMLPVTLQKSLDGTATDQD